MSLFLVDAERDRAGCDWSIGTTDEANELLADHHYLGPLRTGARLTVIGEREGETVAAMMWRLPTSRGLPADGSWLELSRWCLTPAAGDNAGSRMHRAAVRLIRRHLPTVTTLVSYSDPAHGHTGALYRACNWQWAPTWHRLRPPPTGNGNWGTGPQAVKDRWIFSVRRDTRSADVLAVDDLAAIRHWQQRATETERRWAATSEHVQFGDVIPCDQVAVQLDPRPPEACHHALSIIGGDIPTYKRTEHGLRVGLVPGQLHARHLTGRTA